MPQHAIRPYAPLPGPGELPIQFRSTAPASNVYPPEKLNRQIKKEDQRGRRRTRQRTKLIFRFVKLYLACPSAHSTTRPETMQYRNVVVRAAAPGGRAREDDTRRRRLISERKHISPSFPCSVWQHSSITAAAQFLLLFLCILPRHSLLTHSSRSRLHISFDRCLVRCGEVGE